jgi:hypothetical protein
MSILINGMEMPKRGHTITITIVGSGQAYVEYFDCRPHIEETIEYEAVPVPPHGDLIDRNELKENCMKEDSFLAELLFRKVSNAPTIIPAEEG